MKIEVVPSKALHCMELFQTLREKDKTEAEGLGLDPRKAIFSSFRKACYRKTCLVDDEVAAMWGLQGELLGNTGRPYLITGSVSERVSPFQFARVYKAEVEVMHSLFPKLEGLVDFSYCEAVRLLKLVGFLVSDPFRYGPKDALFSRFTLE